MKRNRLSSRKRISADAAELGRLATCLSESGGKLEDLFWEKKLSDLVCHLLQNGAEDDLNASLDRLFDSHAAAHDCLADTIEACAESGILTPDDVRKMRAAAVNAFLVGEAFMRADDPGAELARLFA